MKRTVSLIIALVMCAVSVISCAGSGSVSEETSADASPGTTAEFTLEIPETTKAPAAEEIDPADYYGYLFAYFTGNDPSQERVCFALSRDGYNFKPINKGQPIITSHSGMQGIRDPYIFRGHDGAYYIIATDMRSELGWSSNYDLISWRSEDLIHWTDETVIKVGNVYPVTKNTTRAWAPQAIWDDEKGEYMIYFALQSAGTGGRTIMYYAYSPDLKKLSTEPEILLDPTNGSDAIDADIIKVDDKYYMFFKDESGGGIYLVKSDKLNTGYDYSKRQLVSIPGLAVEGSTTYQLIDGSGWLVIADAYMSGYFTMARTTDFLRYTHLTEGTDFNFTSFTPRHGSVIPITEDQYKALTSAF